MNKKSKGKKKINSRAKGCRGERECRDLFRDNGYKARRGQQFSGSPDSPDVVTSLEGYLVEVKRVEQFNAYKAIEQAEKDCVGSDNKPVVFHKKNGKDWIVILKHEEFFDLLDKAISAGI